MTEGPSLFHLATPLALLILAGCHGTAQTSSGADYLSRYQSSAPAVESSTTYHKVSDGEVVEETIERVSTDELVRRAAEIEPLLQLPARIGIARIDRGQLAALPEQELQLWAPLVQKFSSKGSFVPVDPFLADYTVQAVLPQDRRALSGDAKHVLTKIRLGAARQHLDAVLVYEVGVSTSNRSDYRALSDLTTLGGGFVRSQSIEVEGRARALLIDVRNGYPYGTAMTSIDLSEKLPSWASNEREAEVRDRAVVTITRKLVPEIQQLVSDLVAHMETRVAQKS